MTHKHYALARFRSVTALAGLAVAVGCATRSPRGEIQGAASVITVHGTADTVGILLRTEDVAAVVRFFSARLDGWRKAWVLPRAAPTVLRFGRADGYSEFAWGEDFLRYWKDGDAYSRPMSRAEQDSLVSLLRVTHNCVFSFRPDACRVP